MEPSLSSTPPRVFLSYSWDSDEHSKRVLAFADRLRRDGVDAWIDQYETFPDRGWPRWMEDEIERAQYVIVIASEKYNQRFAARAPHGIGLGVTWEGAIITQELYEAGMVNTKFLPAAFEAADFAHVPKPLRGYMRFLVEDDVGYDKLYRLLTGQPLAKAGPLGPFRELPPTQQLAPLSVPAAQTPTVAPVRTLRQLPTRPDLTGRADELAELERTILAGVADATICGAHLQGMGGVGKTALAVELAYRFKSRWPDAQLFIDLRGANPQKRVPLPPGEAMARVIYAFHPDLPLPEDADAVAPIYRAILADAGAVLLLLDDAADETQVTPLLPPSNCLLIVTSRARFDLPGVATHNLDCLTPDKSRELLLRHTDNRLGASADEAARLCGHLPLALRIFAGAVMKGVSTPERLVERLRSGTLLNKVNAVFEVSAELLPEPLRRQWTALSIFTASFTTEAVAAVWEESEEAAEQALESLVFGSLVEWNRTAGRFRLHDLVRQFCAGQLPPADTWAARLRHAWHYVGVGGRANALYLRGGSGVRQGLDLFDTERAHLDAAFGWLSSCPGPDTAEVLVLLVNAVAHTCELRLHPRERIRWLDAQREAANVTGNRRAEGSILGNLGIAYANLGEMKKAVGLFERHRDIARELGDRQGEGNTMCNLGNAYAYLGEPRKAISFYEQHLAIVRELGDRRGEGTALGNLGNIYEVLGETQKAIGYCQQRLVISREIGDRRGEGTALSGLGNAHVSMDDKHEALGFYEQALAIDREIGDRRGEGAALGSLGSVYRLLGDAHKALDFYEQALAISREVGDRRGEEVAIGNLGGTYSVLGESRKAIDFFEQALVIDREIGDRRGEGVDLWNSAREYWKLGERAEAIARAEAALEIYEAVEDPFAANLRESLARWRGEGA